MDGSRIGDGMWMERKTRAAAWFKQLQSEICGAFEALEDRLDAAPTAAAYPTGAPGRFVSKETKRRVEGGGDAGGGVMRVMRGRLFEKVGVNFSAVYGELGAPAQKALTARKEIPGLAENPMFWASGVSLVAHMRNPRVPAVHMNTRMFWTPGATWFGGGADITPMVRRDDPAWSEDATSFHAALNAACDQHDFAYYERFKAWADEYFIIKHWGEARGAGGVFYDDLNTGDWEADFRFTQSIGRALVDGFAPVVERRMGEPWTDADLAHQAHRRARYAEFNLVYDRGTHFGLATGHNPEAVLMSLPPTAAWP